jgi:tetratricopeptide (TPR) repeat protein
MWGARVSDLRTAGEFPLPDDVVDVADFVRALRALKLWAGDPSLEVLRRRTGVATSTLSDAFNPQRRRMPSLELVRALVRACGADAAQAARWERAWRALRERTDAALPSAVPRPSQSSSPAAGLTRPGQDEWIPRQLPPDVSGFIGRADALVALEGVPRHSPATVLTGTAGVGKTALAVHWAHRIADRYPDGQLYLDLRGHAGDPAIEPAEALPLLLRSLDVPGERIPVDLHLQMGLYRSVLAGRRVLVVLDNVVDVAHVRPMLPSGPHCHALITSRDALTGLVVREGAARITLDTLPAEESVELLATHLGAGRVDEEPDAAAELASLCAHLPLALRICAANLAARPSQTIAGTVRELGSSDLLGRLHVVGDPESAVAAAFDVSYRSLPPEAQRLFRLLGLVPGPEVDREATALLLGRDRADPVPELDELLAAHLMFEPRPGRHRTHDLLSLYARRHAADEPAPVREAALHRLLSWYLLTTDAVTRIILPGFSIEDRTELALTGVPQDFAGPDDALAWLETELPNLAAAAIHAAEHGPAPFAWHLANGLAGFMHTRRSGVEQLALARAGLRAAEIADHPLGQAVCHISMGLAALTLDDLRTAGEEFDSAHQQFTRIHHTRGINTASNNLGDICIRLGDINSAVRHIEEALTGQPDINPTKVMHISNLAMVHKILGNHAEALRLDSECLAFAERIEATHLIATVKMSLGMDHLDLDDPETAEALLLESHSTAEQLGSEVDVYDALAGLVLVYARTGRTDEAFTWIAPLRELLDRGQHSYAGDDWAYAAILEAHLAAGRLDEAVAIGVPALDRYDKAGHRLTAMRLRILLGRIHAALGDTEAARRHWESALPYAAEQNLPDRARIEALLAGAPAA